MSFLCWLLGHKPDIDFIGEDYINICQTKDALLRGKKIGTVDCGYQLRFCKRCDAVFHEKYVKEYF